LPLTELQLPLEALGLFTRQQRRASAADATHVEYSDPLEPLARALTPEQVRQLKETGDREADDIVEAIFDEHGAIPASAERINAIFQTLGTLADSDPQSLSGLSTTLGKRAQDFLETLPALDVDEERLESARSLFRSAGFGVPMVLFCSSLPQCFAVPYGAKVLMSSGRLVTNPRRRLVETAQLVFDVLAPGGLSASSPEEVRAALAAGRRPRGGGIRTARKVRLMHAAIRKLVRERRGQSAEIPISQFELIGTLMTFSVVVTDGLRALGLTVTEQQAEDWFQIWLAVGKVLGVQIPAGLSLKTAADGADFFDHVRHDWAPSEEGSALARVTLALMKDLLPGDPLDGLGATLVRHLAGERCADILGVEPADWTRSLVERSPLVTTILGNVVGGVFETPLTPLLQQAAFGTMEALARQEREDKGAPFAIPPQLINGWRNQFQAKLRPL